MLKPLPAEGDHRATRAATRPSDIQRLLVKEIYLRYHVRPAAWEIEGILAVAQTQSVLTPLATQEGLQSRAAQLAARAR